MTDHDDLERLDHEARRAADGLREHVARHVSPSPGLWESAPGASGRRRLGVLGAVAALLVGALVLADQRGDGGPPDPDGEEATLDLEPSVLQLAGPRDGNESIGLPLIVEPSTGLEDGQRVTVTGGGFTPGESVGIVQCAEAMPDQPGDAIDSCDIGQYTPATASSDGVATGEYPVKRILTTPRTGTVDCLAEAGRCVVAMGALNDYDRSGVHEIQFATGEPGTEEPVAPEIPTATVAPMLGLADGDTIRVEGTGFAPGEPLTALLCSVDPAVCWQLAADPGQGDPFAISVDADGRVGVDLQVWRFLPGDQPGTYVDCAVSRCQLRLDGSRVPEPIVLGFAAGGPPPTGAAVSVEPSAGLAPGDAIRVAGAGFAPDTPVGLQLCATPPDDLTALLACVSVNGAEVTTDRDGSFSVEALVPAFDPGQSVTTTSCAPTPGECQPGEVTPLDVRCDGVETACTLRASALEMDAGYGRPTFPPAPVPITFRVPG